MIEVSKGDFYKYINPRDIVVRAEGDYPFVSVFRTRGGQVIGKITENRANPIPQRYFLNGAAQ